jgi:hypothetical protein
MNNYKDIMEDLDGKSDIQTDEELLLFSETESEEEESLRFDGLKSPSNIEKKKRKIKPKV